MTECSYTNFSENQTELLKIKKKQNKLNYKVKHERSSDSAFQVKYVESF